MAVGDHKDPKKIVWIDVETTGLDCNEHDIIQLAIIIFINNEPIVQKSWNVQPFRYDNITRKALEVTGLTIDQIKSFIPPRQVYAELHKILSTYVNKYDSNDKYYIGGYNTRFDLGFLSHFFEKNNDHYFGSFFSWKAIDVMVLVDFLDFNRQLPFKLTNRQLSTVCIEFDIPLIAHNAESDIRATIQLYNRLLKLILKEEK